MSTSHNAGEPKAFGVVIPVSDEIITVLCPRCRLAGQADRVGNRLYGECHHCGWTGAQTISRERMKLLTGRPWWPT